MKLTMDLGNRSYAVVLKRGALERVGQLAALHRRVLVVSDAGVPEKNVKALLRQCGQGFSFVLPRGGDASGEPTAWLELCRKMQAEGFAAEDALVAVGGSAVCHVAGFAAGVYRGGISCIMVPTTTAAQLDAAVGGRARLGLAGRREVLGLLHQPQLVVADPDTLDTLPPRHRAAGMAHALKTALVASPELFAILEKEDVAKNYERILYLCLQCKMDLVARDEACAGPLRLLELGGLVANAMAAAGGGDMPEGERLALGLLPMLETKVLARRTRAVMKKLGLPLKYPLPAGAICAALADPGLQDEGLYTLPRVKALGKGYLERVSLEELQLLVEAAY